MNVADAVIDCLVANEVDVVFGIPGKQTLPLNAHIDERDDLRFVMARHETAVSHQAWGYAETSGRMAATLVVPGPGDMNAMNGLKNALNDCTPLVHLAVETEPAVRGGDGIHETPPETYDTVVKENVTVERPAGTVAELERAIAIAQTPPKGPVRVGIPKDFLELTVEQAATATYRPDDRSAVPQSAIDRAAALLAGARAPIVIAGGGVRAADASPALVALAERLDAPVVTSVKGKGTVPADHPLSVGVAGASASPELDACVADADAALAVGTDFDAVWTGTWSLAVPEELVHVTLDSSVIGRGYEPAVGILADAAAVLPALDDALAARGVDGRAASTTHSASGAGSDGPSAGGTGSDDPSSGGTPSDGERRARAVREATRARLAPLRADSEPPLTSVRALTALREAVPREAIVTADAGGSRIWTLVSFPVYEPRAYVNPGSWASMGVGVPAAIGAAVANPDRPVVSIVGEGGLMMCLEELHTIATEGLAVIVVAFNNDDYAIISEEAERTMQGEPSRYGWQETPLDLSAIASGMGLRAAAVETPEQLVKAVESALSNDGGTLIEVATDPHEPQASEWMGEDRRSEHGAE